MSVALLVVRVVVGCLFAGHGCQKLFGWLGGHGLAKTAAFFEGARLAPGLPLALLAGAAELAGGALLGLGFLVPVAACLLAAVMATAIAAVHWRNGIWVADGGFELPLVMATVAFAVPALGPGRYSVDRWLGVDWSGLGWALAAVGIGAAASLLTLLVSRAWQRARHRSQAQPA